MLGILLLSDFQAHISYLRVASIIIISSKSRLSLATCISQLNTILEISLYNKRSTNIKLNYVYYNNYYVCTHTTESVGKCIK